MPVLFGKVKIKNSISIIFNDALMRKLFIAPCKTVKE